MRQVEWASRAWVAGAPTAFRVGTGRRVAHSGVVSRTRLEPVAAERIGAVAHLPVPSATA